MNIYIYIFALLYWFSLSQRLTVRCPPPSDWWGVLSDSRTVSTVRVVLTLGLPCLLIYLSHGYAWRVFAFVFFALVLFFPFPSGQIGGGFLVCYFFPLFLFFCLCFFGCSDGMEREACVCDHGFERSDLCAEIIIIIIHLQ